jgi:hypothetical protein
VTEKYIGEVRRDAQSCGAMAFASQVHVAGHDDIPDVWQDSGQDVTDFGICKSV